MTSAKLFLERYGVRATYRNPAPTLSPDDIRVHRVPQLKDPLPIVDALWHKPPLADRGATLEPWPRGEGA